MLKKDNFIELIKEIIEPSQINTDVLKLKDTLNPQIFNENEEMYNDVRKIILLNAYEFIKYTKIDDLKIKDIILTGSNAGYNWNKFSDIDVHILLDFNQISNNKEFVREFFKTKKNIWNDEKNIKIKGFDVEIYVQDINEPHTSKAIYSVLNNKWLSKPIKQMISIDLNNIKQKTSNIMNLIDEILQIKDTNKLLKYIKFLKEKIKKYRQSGLEKYGIYSTENLVFKLLRNYGYLDKLNKIENTIISNKLTLENF